MIGLGEFWLVGVLPALGIVARATRLVTTDTVPFAGLRTWAMTRPDRSPIPPDAKLRTIRRITRFLSSRIDRHRGVDRLFDKGLHCDWCVSVWLCVPAVLLAWLAADHLLFHLVAAAAWSSWLTGVLNSRLG